MQDTRGWRGVRRWVMIWSRVVVVVVVLLLLLLLLLLVGRGLEVGCEFWCGLVRAWVRRRLSVRVGELRSVGVVEKVEERADVDGVKRVCAEGEGGSTAIRGSEGRFGILKLSKYCVGSYGESLVCIYVEGRNSA